MLKLQYLLLIPKFSLTFLAFLSQNQFCIYFKNRQIPNPIIHGIFFDRHWIYFNHSFDFHSMGIRRESDESTDFFQRFIRFWEIACNREGRSSFAEDAEWMFNLPLASYV